MKTVKELLIIRHGETEYNRMGVIQGSGVDTELNAKGIAQARQFYARYHNYGFDKIYISGLKRTRQSVQQFLENNVLYEELPELNEISWGIYEGQQSNPDWKADYLNMIKQWGEGHYQLRVPGGESPLELNQRQQVALNKIMQASDEQRVLICMHGRAMKSFLCLLLNRELKYMEDFQHSNLCLYKLHYINNRFELVESNNTQHLEEQIN